MLLSLERCGCARPLALYCWLISGKLLAGQRKTPATGNLLLEAQRALKIEHVITQVPRA